MISVKIIVRYRYTDNIFGFMCEKFLRGYALPYIFVYVYAYINIHISGTHTVDSSHRYNKTKLCICLLERSVFSLRDIAVSFSNPNLSAETVP